MKDKNYFLDCAIGGENCRPIIVIKYDKCTFLVNDSIQKAWTQEGETFLQPKGRKQGIIIFKFLLPFGCLNFLSL